MNSAPSSSTKYETLDASFRKTVSCMPGIVRDRNKRSKDVLRELHVTDLAPSGPESELGRSLRALAPHLEELYSATRAREWSLSFEKFRAAILRSAQRQFRDAPATTEPVRAYLETLNIEDLVLASACMEGSEVAWEYFVHHYRGYLRASAVALTRGSRTSGEAVEMADSLFAELFGMIDGKRGERSLFRYFHGRSSLRTWLRTILAQRQVDRLRETKRRWEPVEGDDRWAPELPVESASPCPAPDPDRARYLHLFTLALGAALDALPSEDRTRVELYYAREKTLAEIGRVLREHESSVSRHLLRIRRELRARVEEHLRARSGTARHELGQAPLDEAEIALAFEYAAEEVPIDFERLFPTRRPERPPTGTKDSP